MENALDKVIITLALINFIAMMFVTNDLRKDVTKLETKIFKLEMERYTKPTELAKDGE